MSTPISQLGIQPSPNTNPQLNMSGQMGQPSMGGAVDSTQRRSPIETPSYADLLKNMQNDVTRDQEIQQNAETQQLQMQNQMYQNQIQQMQQQQMQQHQQMQQQHQMMPPDYNDEYIDDREESNNKQEVRCLPKDETLVDFQTEIVILLLIHCFVHLEACQTMMKSKIPSAYSSMTNAPTMVGVVINGIFVVFIWIIMRKFMKHYMKQ